MDLKDKTLTDLTVMLAEKRKALSNFRFAIKGSKMRDVREGRNLRREIARIATELALRPSDKAR